MLMYRDLAAQPGLSWCGPFEPTHWMAQMDTLHATRLGHLRAHPKQVATLSPAAGPYGAHPIQLGQLYLNQGPLQKKANTSWSSHNSTS
mmetsp:Transcript_86062/g.143599  ORF Transcript_86062/g.143599 Transcript_86062/m.143599 type:complete len:89 (-) Transcript_86062:655-921(-)